MEEKILEHQNLISNITFLRERYYKEPNFNHFLLFGSPWDEVNLHSQFLYFLLDANAAHQLGNTFLKLFIEQYECLYNFDISNCQTYKEENHIDIRIKNNQRQSIIIENKINATDQNKQLYNYITLIESKGEKVFTFYLTIGGREPSEQSVEGLTVEQKKEIKHISYNTDIREFILKAIEKASIKPALRESLVQYLEIIDLITGKNPNSVYMEKLTKLLLINENLLIANDIKNAIQNCYAEQLLKIWLNLDNNLKKYPDIYSKKTSKPFSIDTIKRYLSNPSRNYGYGYIFDINQIQIIINTVDGIEWRLNKIDSKKYENAIKKINMQGIEYRGNDEFIFFHVSNNNFDMRNPLSRDCILFLIDEKKLEEYAAFVVDNVINLYETYLHEIEYENK